LGLIFSLRLQRYGFSRLAGEPKDGSIFITCEIAFANIFYICVKSFKPKAILMKIQNAFLPFLLAVLVLLSGCGNKGIKKDAEKIGDAMCRHIEVMSKLRIVDPNDTVATQKLQADGVKLQAEMQLLYKEFGEKYGDKTKDPDFSKKFSRELRKAMLNCPYLSKQDRAQFEKELNEK
jgi:hypothetical protein